MGADGDDEPKMTEADKRDLEKFREEFEKNKDNLKNGPITNRFITDCFCCFLFIVFMLGMGVVFVYGQMYGKPSLITVGWDGNVPQRGCGYLKEMAGATNDGLPDYPYLYFVKGPTKEQFETISNVASDPYAVREVFIDLLNQGTCVKECPMMDTDMVGNCMPTSKMIDAGCENCECNMVDSDDVNIPFRYDTKATPWGNGFCIPMTGDGTNESVKTVIEGMKKQLTQSDQGQSIQGWISDITASWMILIISSVTALVLGYLYLWVIRILGGYIIWVSLILIELSLLAAGGYTWYYRDLKYRPDNPIYDYMTYGAYFLWGLCGIILILLCCFWHAIKIGIAVFKTTSQYVQANLKIFILPALSYITIGVWVVFWVAGALFVFSVGYPEPRDDGYPFLTIMRWDDITHAAFFYDVFGLFWVNAFIIGVCQFIIGCSACLWYFEQSTDTKGAGTVGRGFYWAYRYHLGSVAFGSFIIAVCQMMRFLFEYYRKKIGVAEKTKLVKALLCLTGYLLWLMDKCVKFISKNAYIQVALQNTHFFKSAWNGFALVIKHAHRFGAAASIGNIFMVTGALMIMSLNAFLGYLFLTNFTFVEVASPIPPVVAICFISLMIAYTFLSIFSFSSDAILQSFLLDEELRFQGGDRPEYMQEFADELKKRGKGCCGGCCGC